MTEQMRNDLTPQGYIRHMFAETENGRFTVGYKNPDNNFIEEERIFEVRWTADDAEEIEEKYNLLTFALARIGRIHNQIEDEESRRRLLSKSDFEVYNTYVKPYEPMKVNWDELYPIPPCEPDELMWIIHDIHERSRYGDLVEEEEKSWKQYSMWKEEQSQQRIPFNRRSCANMIERAMRYERFISMGAPEIVITEEGRCLAEEMALYYFGKDEPIEWD